MGSRLFSVSLAVAFTCFFVSAAAAQEACPDKFDQLSLESDGTATCECKGGGGGSVWGSGTYTADSNLCGAARHVGAIGSSGGTVTVKKSSGCSAYTGSSANSMTTSSWTPHPNSFYFVGKGDGKCPSANGDTCPATLSGGGDGELKCTCGKNPEGQIWGTTVYTIDSDVCTAAVHSGAITSSGGTVKVKTKGGCIRYQSSTQNGVTSGEWGEYHGSFYFVGTTDGACP